MSPLILTIIFIIISLGLLIYNCFINNENIKLKHYLVASTVVYVSATIFIFVLTFIMKKITLPLVIVLEVAVLVVYIFDYIILKVITHKLDDLHQAAMNNKEKVNNENITKE